MGEEHCRVAADRAQSDVVDLGHPGGRQALGGDRLEIDGSRAARLGAGAAEGGMDVRSDLVTARAGARPDQGHQRPVAQLAQRVHPLGDQPRGQPPPPAVQHDHRGRADHGHRQAVGHQHRRRLAVAIGGLTVGLG